VTSGADAAELRKRLNDPRQLCTALGLLDGYKPGRQAGGGLLIRCPAHGERHPSCSVRRGRDGTIQVRCFSCDFGGDALSLVAVARGLDPRADFLAVLSEATRLVGCTSGLPSRSSYAPLPPPEFPAADEVADLWETAVAIETDPEATAYLCERAIDPGAIDLYQLARVLPPGTSAPSWARCRGKPWPVSHRLVLPVVDHNGVVRSLRAWRIDGAVDGTPKRVAPASKALAGLVLACPVARQMLATGQAPSWASAAAPLDVVIAEGEPDFLTWATRVNDSCEAPPAILGVVAGAWGDALADRIPDGSRVVIRTHQDTSGNRYAAEIKASFAGRSVVLFDLKRGNHGENAA